MIWNNVDLRGLAKNIAFSMALRGIPINFAESEVNNQSCVAQFEKPMLLKFVLEEYDAQKRFLESLPKTDGVAL